MPRDFTLKKVLIIGSGPIIIGQAAEFDYLASIKSPSIKPKTGRHLKR